MSKEKRVQRKKSAEAIRLEQRNDPFGRHHGVHEDQLHKVNHNRRRRNERQDDKNWEGHWD